MVKHVVRNTSLYFGSRNQLEFLSAVDPLTQFGFLYVTVLRNSALIKSGHFEDPSSVTSTKWSMTNWSSVQMLFWESLKSIFVGSLSLMSEVLTPNDKPTSVSKPTPRILERFLRQNILSLLVDKVTSCHRTTELVVVEFSLSLFQLLLLALLHWCWIRYR